MGNEAPKEVIHPDEGEQLESLDYTDEIVDTGRVWQPEELDQHDVGIPEISADPGSSPSGRTEEPKLVVVDPYTAAPVPSLSSEDRVEGGREAWQDHITPDDPFTPLPYSPTSQGESIRRSGLAWSAGIAFFGSVAFTLFLGWIADLLLGISPWGIIGGIIFGSIIGFVQFFRITSRIFPSSNNGPEISPLMSHKDDE